MTLTSDMLIVLSRMTKLEKLEINGRSGTYDAELLKGLKKLKELRIHMPDRQVVGVLEPLAKGLQERGGGLEGLEILARVCIAASRCYDEKGKPSTSQLTISTFQDPRFINDQLLMSLAPYLNKLRSFKLLGTEHVGPKGYFAICRSAADTLEELGLEAIGWVSSLGPLSSG